ncbi:MAG: hypothetical protein ACRCTY_09290, partial [Candidatus Adiutrix sp.]
MAKELVAFLNFTFEQKKVFIKSVSGETITEVARFVVNWRDYQAVLASLKLKSEVSERPLFQRYLSHKPDDAFFNDLVSFQAELRGILKLAVCEGTVPAEVWVRIFKETSGLPMIIEPVSDGPLSPENLLNLDFHYDFEADT